MPDALPRARRLRRPAPRRLRRRSHPPATGRAFPSVSSGRRSLAPSVDAADVDFAAAVAFRDSGRVASRPGYPAEPASGLGPSGGYPSRLRSLRSLRGPLARRFASLTAACLAASVVHRAGIPVLPPPRSALALPRLPWPAAPASGCASAAGVRIRERRLARSAARPLTRRGGSPPVPFPEPVPRRSVPWVRSFLRPSAARLSHPTQRAARYATRPFDTLGDSIRIHVVPGKVQSV